MVVGDLAAMHRRKLPASPGDRTPVVHGAARGDDPSSHRSRRIECALNDTFQYRQLTARNAAAPVPVGMCLALMYATKAAP